MAVNRKIFRRSKKKTGTTSGRSFIRPEERPDLTSPVLKKRGT
ncbi:MAG: hypothetical protein WBP79_11410 [Candidatus Acidiferrales bacterium]